LVRGAVLGSVTIKKYLRKLTYEEKRFISLMALEVLVHDQLVLLLRARGETAHHRDSVWQSKTIHIKNHGIKRQKRTKPKIPLCLISSWPKDLSLGSTSQIEPSLQHVGHWEGFLIQDIKGRGGGEGRSAREAEAVLLDVWE
jgi:hypothetical protein